MKVKGKTYSYSFQIHRRVEPYIFIFWIIQSLFLESSINSILICLLFPIAGFLHASINKLMFRETVSFSGELVLKIDETQLSWLDPFKLDDKRFNIEIPLNDIESYYVDSFLKYQRLEIIDKKGKLYQLQYIKTEKLIIEAYLTDILKLYHTKFNKPMTVVISPSKLLKYIYFPFVAIAVIYNLRVLLL